MSQRIKRHVQSDYTSIPNATLRDPNISAKAKGLLAILLSYPDDWGFNQEHISSLSSDGKHAHRSGFNELEEAGYIKREKVRDGGQFSGVLWHVSDRPIFSDDDPNDDENPPEKATATDVGKPDIGSPDTGEPHTTKTDLTNRERRARGESKPPDPDAGTMLDPNYMFLPMWKRQMNQPFTPRNQVQRQKLHDICRKYTESQIKDAMKTTKDRAPDNLWGYFVAVLESEDKPKGGRKDAKTTAAKRGMDLFDQLARRAG